MLMGLTIGELVLIIKMQGLGCIIFSLSNFLSFKLDIAKKFDRIGIQNFYGYSIHHIRAEVRITTDDGSYGVKGFVIDQLHQFIDKQQLDCTLAKGKGSENSLEQEEEIHRIEREMEQQVHYYWRKPV